MSNKKKISTKVSSQITLSKSHMSASFVKSDSPRKGLHSGENPHVCNICEKRFAHKGNLKTHCRIHTGDKPHACSVCEKMFSRKGDLKRHYHIHTGDKSHACSVCKMKFFRKSDLKKHYKTHIKPHECEVCHKRFAQQGILLKHKLLHKELFSCNICLMGFDDQVSLERHLLLHSGNKLHICDICGKCFLQKNVMLRHCLLHHSAAELQKGELFNQAQHSQVVDVVSGFLETTEVSRECHLLSSNSDKLHICDICGKGFLKRNTMLKHCVLQHSAAELQKVKLSKQAQRSQVLVDVSSSGLSAGATQEVNLPNQCSRPAKVKSHICDICQKSFLTKSSRDRHCLLTHLSKQL